MSAGGSREPDWARIEELFHAALDRPEGERARYLDGACGGDAGLRERVAALLRDHDATADDWDATRAGSETATFELLRPGDRVGRYRVADRIGGGGMGTVYEAWQDDPRRQVALKVMRADVGAPDAARRFRYEAHVLARLHHPGVAQVYDAGTLERDGRTLPFFAMELIPGARTLADFVRDEGPSTHERLRLFVRVCEAVQHGHAQGVIHRDLKPGNVLVDEDGRPVVIDFGVARALEPDARQTALTGAGQVIGTVAYMSPEQCLGDSEALDIRSDVYSLGVLLFELLTGELPYPVAGKTPLEGLRTVCEARPARLSSLDRRLRGDLETIVARALEKEPDGRYATAHELARDVSRFLDGEPVVARGRSSLYLLRTFVRRHRALAAALAVAFASLAAAVAITVPLYLETQRALDAALVENQKGHEVVEFLVDTLLSADPLEGGSGELTVRQLLDSAAAEIERELADRPEVRAVIEDAIGSAYSQLGLVDEAERHLARALELHRAHLAHEPALLANALYHAAGLELRRGRFARSGELVEEALAILDAHPGAVERVPTLPGALLYLRGSLAAREARRDDAERDLRTALEHARALEQPRPDLVATAAEGLANVFNHQGRLEEALRWYEHAIELTEESAGRDDPSLGYSFGNLATVLRDLGHLERAEAAARRSLELLERHYGPEHYTVAITRMTLAEILADRGRVADAEELFRSGFALLTDALGEGHPELATPRFRLGELLDRLGRPEEALVEYRAAVAMAEEALDADHALARRLRLQLADVHVAGGQFAEAEELLLPPGRAEEEVTPEEAELLARLYRRWQSVEPSADRAERAGRWAGRGGGTD